MVVTNLSVIKYLTAGHAGGLGDQVGVMEVVVVQTITGGWCHNSRIEQQLQFTNNYLLLLQSLLSHFAEWQLLLQPQTQEAVLQYLPTGVLHCSSRNFTKRNFTVLQYLPTWTLQCCSTYQQELYSVAVLTNRNFTVLQYLPKGILQCCSTYQKELYNDKLSPVSIATKLFTEQHAELQKHSLWESDQMESCAPMLLQQQVAKGLWWYHNWW